MCPIISSKGLFGTEQALVSGSDICSEEVWYATIGTERPIWGGGPVWANTHNRRLLLKLGHYITHSTHTRIFVCGAVWICTQCVSANVEHGTPSVDIGEGQTYNRWQTKKCLCLVHPHTHHPNMRQLPMSRYWSRTGVLSLRHTHTYKSQHQGCGHPCHLLVS